ESPPHLRPARAADAPGVPTTSRPFHAGAGRGVPTATTSNCSLRAVELRLPPTQLKSAQRARTVKAAAGGDQRQSTTGRTVQAPLPYPSPCVEPADRQRASVARGGLPLCTWRMDIRRQLDSRRRVDA